MLRLQVKDRSLVAKSGDIVCEPLWKSLLHTVDIERHMLDFAGIELLKEDRKFVNGFLKGNRKNKVELVAAYIEVWLAEMEKEPVSYRKQNVGRFAANTWLRTRGGGYKSL